MLRVPVITECFHAHVIQDTSSRPGDHHPDLCILSLLNPYLLYILKLTLTFDLLKWETVSSAQCASNVSQKHYITMETGLRLQGPNHRNVYGLKSQSFSILSVLCPIIIFSTPFIETSCLIKACSAKNIYKLYIMWTKSQKQYLRQYPNTNMLKHTQSFHYISARS